MARLTAVIQPVQSVVDLIIPDLMFTFGGRHTIITHNEARSFNSIVVSFKAAKIVRGKQQIQRLCYFGIIKADVRPVRTFF